VGGAELGNKGGNGGSSSQAGGGGGGAGSAGANGVDNGTPAAGGSGTNLTFSGVPVTYAAGGGGRPRAQGGANTPFTAPSGAANTGNGGGGGAGSASQNGAAGGSGIVIVRYVDGQAFSASVTATSATAQWPVQVGAFTITRPDDANTNYSATVSYTMSGTATNGTDYSANTVINGSTGYQSPTPTPLSGLATFAPGVTSVVVNVYPLYNPPFSAKTATMTLNIVGTPTADVTFPAWSAAGGVVASGGVLTNYFENGTNFNGRIFTNSVVPETLTLTSGGTIEYMVVAGGGGGGGGWNGGGGGAGGVRLGSVTLPAGAYTVTVGAGGPGANRLGSHPPSNGLPSVISAAVGVVSATGGGHGHSEIFYDARDWVGNGGSGGGSGGTAAGGGELGNNGGTGSQDWTGGGGGARTVGGTGSTSNQGLGGGGTNLTFSGVSVTYAAGGNGCAGRNGVDGANALANTGNGGSGGGGGTSIKGGNGGDGIVVVRYIIPPPPKGTVILLR